MDWPQRKKYSEKRPPDKTQKPKPKYIPKEEAIELPPKEETTEKPKKKQYPRQRKEYFEKPKLTHGQSSETGPQCLICSQGIRNRDPIWTCSNCRIFLHLRCIKQWIRKTNDQEHQDSKFIFNWQCIQCKSPYSEPMPEYFCYCGKQKNPEFQRDLEPHSCGRLCQKKRGAYCTHPCPDLCHSGKCRPCEFEGATINCHCGKTERTVKCSEDRPVFQCGKKCERQLNCHKHKCQRNCHPGPCLPCKKKHMAECYCGKNSDIIDCAETAYSCKEFCGRILECGYHKCERLCHEGACWNCQKTPQLQKTCCCGRYSLLMISEANRQSCKDPIPSCGMPCKKKLDCGHECPLICHEGICPECKVTVEQACDCGAAVRKVQCCVATSAKEEFHCETVCKKKRICGIHTCNQICCRFRTSPIPADHPCQLTCQRVLNCEKHTCDLPCHAGLCKKCPVIYSRPQPCPCGATSLRPPVVCGTVVPECGNICNKKMDCGHLCRQLCHYGQCRCIEEVQVECRCGREVIQTVCGKQTLCLNKCQEILKCGHKCLVQCHRGACPFSGENGCKKKCEKTRSDCNHRCRQICHPKLKCEQFPCQAEILIKCECGHRQTTVLCGSKGSQPAKLKEIKCNKKCENLKRFDVLYKGKDIYYPNPLVQFGFKNFLYLQKLEEKLNRFILESDANFIEVDFKFLGDNYSKNAMLNLFENHYHLNAHFYRHMKSASITLMQTEDTMVPKPCLSDYIKQIAKGYIKRTLPFEYTIKFDAEPREKVEVILRSLKPFLHQYYIQRKQRMIHAHFWSKDEALKAKMLLQAEHQTTDFRGSENLEKLEEEKIEEDQIYEKVLEQKLLSNDELEQLREGNEEISQEISRAEKEEKVSPRELSSEKKEEKMKPEKEEEGKKIPKIIVRPSAPNFVRNEYPPSKQNVQDFYVVDDDELFGERIDWDKLIEELRGKKMGIQASQWRIRTLIMINKFHRVDEKILNEEFMRIFKMYEKDKEKAKRILQIQRIETKNVQEEMRKNQIYLSEHQPEIVSYFLLHNALAEDKVQFLPTEQCAQTRQVQRAADFIQWAEEFALQDFYTQFLASDYLFCCALVPLITQMRRQFLLRLSEGKKILSKNVFDYLLFDSEDDLCQFAKENGLFIEKKISKNKKEETWKVVEGKIVERMQLQRDLHKRIEEKRNKKYFLTEVEELVDDKWMTRSFFAFGDFKETVHSKYINTLSRKLKEA